TPADGYEGVCKGARREAFVSSGVDAIDGAVIRKILEPIMPLAGEDRSRTADVYQSVHDACIELMGGEVAEALLLDGEPALASDDRRQASELAQLVGRTPEAVSAFIGFCRQQAADLLGEHVPLLMSLQIVLRMRRVMTGEEIDRAIATILAE